MRYLDLFFGNQNQSLSQRLAIDLRDKANCNLYNILQILQLEKRLKDQLTIRYALEKALGHSSSAMCSSNDSSMPKVSGQINGLNLFLPFLV